MRLRLVAPLSALALVSSGCTSFSSVRPAAVRPGTAVTVQASATTPPGPEAGWFWSYDCTEACSHPIVGAEAGVTHGWSRGPGGRPAALGAGLNGTHLYVDGYLQLGGGGGRAPYGVGARAGVPVTSWLEHQLYARYDVRIRRGATLLLNPALFVHHGRAPNGENPGSFVAVVQGIGVQFDGGRASVTPSLAAVIGRAERTSLGRRFGPATRAFATASIGVTLHGRRPADR